MSDDDDDDDVLIRCLFEMLMLFVLPSSEGLLWKEVLEDGKLWQLDAELHANQSAGEEGRGELVTLRVKPKWAWLRQVCKVPHTRQSADLHAEKKTAGRAAGSQRLDWSAPSWLLDVRVVEASAESGADDLTALSWVT